MHRTITTTRIMVCVDCLFAIANGDMPEEDDRAAEVEAGMKDACGARGWLAAGDSENDDTFSWSSCECCGSRLGGSRHEAFICEPAE